MRYFLGANSPTGFYSLYDDFVSLKDGDFLWIIKGGPGCGKSSFMRKVGHAAEDAGMAVEYIYCSGDPDSIDGIYIPEAKIAYADGTPPHVMDLTHAGVSSLYVDMSVFYDRTALKGQSREITDATERYKEHYVRAYSILGAAGGIAPSRLPELFGDEEAAVVLKRAKGVISRELTKHGSGESRTKRRFISAVTCEGEVFYGDTVEKLCDRVYTLDNDFGMASMYLNRIRRAANERGIAAVICPDPMCPENLEAVLLPELSLGFLAISSRRGYDGSVYRHVRLDAISEGKAKTVRPRYRAALKQYNELLRAAAEELAEARRLYAGIEGVYNPYVDFDGVYELAERHIKNLIS